MKSAQQAALLPPNGEAQRAEIIPPVAENDFLALAIKHNANIETIERIVAMRNQEREYQAKKEFNEALNRVQAKIERVAPNADNPQSKSKYANYAALDKMVRPLYIEEGFSLSFDNEDSPQPDHVRVVAYLSRGGHTRKYRKDICADGKGAKGGDVMTRTWAQGAADTYGMRYLLKKIFNIAVGEDDTDGNLTTGEVADFIASIEGSGNWDELKTKFWQAKAHAVKCGNNAALGLYLQTYDKRANQLRSR